MNFSYLRDVGAFQWMCILVFGITCGFNVQTNMAILFVAPTIDFHCDDPAASFRNLTWNEQEKLMTGSGRCNRPDLNMSEYSSDELANLNMTGRDNYRKCETGYVYDHTNYDYTVTEQYDLVCGRKWMISMSKTAYMLGYFIGAVGSGVISDRFGRKISVVIFAAANALFSIMSAFSPTAEVFLLARCLVGASSIAYYTTGLILNTELVQKHQRKVPRTVLSLSNSTMMIGFVGVTYLLRDHRYLQCYIAAAMAGTTVIVWLVLPESPRWLAAEGRHDEAVRIVNRIAKFNSWERADMNNLLKKDTVESDQAERQANITDLFRTPVLRKRILSLSVIWFAHVLTVYALTFNLGSFYHDLRVSLLISQAIEVPLLILPISLIDVVGRQILTFSFLFVGGVACLGMTPLVGQGGSTALLIVSVVGKISLICQFFVSYIYTQELMPTVVRSQGVGLASTVSRIGGMLAPQIVLLDDFWPASSAVLLGVCALIGATLALLLPDTTGSELPQSIADGEGFKAKHVFKLDYPRRRHRRTSVDDSEDEVDVANVDTADPIN